MEKTKNFQALIVLPNQNIKIENLNLTSIMNLKFNSFFLKNFINFRLFRINLDFPPQSILKKYLQNLGLNHIF